MPNTTQENYVLPRRRFLAYSLASAGLLNLEPAQASAPVELLVPNVTGLYSVQVARILTVQNTNEVVHALKDWKGRVAVGGGRYSMGGQVGIRGGLHLDMRSMKSLVWLKKELKQVRVQAGMVWRDLQDVIDPYNLSIKIMQSFSNFSIGGSVAVNVHGRYVGSGAICNSIRALQVVLADGSIVEATAHKNEELFRAVIGGYGAFGVITEVELDLVDNQKMERIVHSVSLDKYPEYFQTQVLNDSSSIMHNADLIPPYFDRPIAITWRASDQALTEVERLIARGKLYTKEKNAIWALSELPFSRKLRERITQETLNEKPIVKWRNHEASLDVAMLEPRTRLISTYVLQEYFIPIRHFLSFAKSMSTILQRYEVEALNVSIRHAPKDSLTLLPWAKEEVFSFVLYFKQRTHLSAQNEVATWTKALIDAALKHEGRYYLPYQLHATQQQFERAYPEIAQLRALKKKFDPSSKLMNAMWEKYL